MWYQTTDGFVRMDDGIASYYFGAMGNRITEG